MSAEGTTDPTLSDGEPVEASLQATAWSRLWARALDIQVAGGALSLLVLGLFPGLLAADIFAGSSGNLLFGLIMLPLALLLDAIILALFGQTPGKAIAGIRVETIRHERLSIAQAIERNLLIYTRGLFIGIPILSLIGPFLAFNDLKANRQAYWDRDSFTRVFSKRHNAARSALAAVLVLVTAIGVQKAAQFVGPSALDQIEASIPALNSDLPKFVDSATMVDRVIWNSSDRMIVFKYTVVPPNGSGLTEGDLRSSLESPPFGQSLRREYCNGSELRFYRENSVLVLHEYKFHTGAPLKEFLLSPADC